MSIPPVNKAEAGFKQTKYCSELMGARVSVFEPPLSETPSTREVPNLKHRTPKTDAEAIGAQVAF
jgi:hypothetical protein